VAKSPAFAKPGWTRAALQGDITLSREDIVLPGCTDSTLPVPSSTSQRSLLAWPWNIHGGHLARSSCLSGVTDCWLDYRDYSTSQQNSDPWPCACIFQNFQQSSFASRGEIHHAIETSMGDQTFFCRQHLDVPRYGVCDIRERFVFTSPLDDRNRLSWSQVNVILGLRFNKGTAGPVGLSGTKNRDQ